MSELRYKIAMKITVSNTRLIFLRKNRQVGQPLIINYENSVKKSNWNPAHPTRIVTHGWQGDTKTGSNCALIRDGRITFLIT